MSYAVVDGCPVPAELAPVLETILRESGARLQSCYRGDDARALLHKLGKSSQKELYDGFVAGRQGFNPANRPGQSTHELRSDGVAYRGPVGRQLVWWQVGIDIDDGHVEAFHRLAGVHGWIATVTYPGSRSEYHHLNFRKAPLVPFPTLKSGSKGPRVALLTRRLTKLGYLDHAYWVYNAQVEAAVRRFQKHWHRRVDGRVGAQTAKQLAVSLRTRGKA